MSKSKDCWDKAEVVSKFLVPVVVGVSVWLWNSERTNFQTTATMTQIAIGVLNNEPDDGETDALRDWAIDVLQNPSDPPPLSDVAADRLRIEALRAGGVGGAGGATRGGGGGAGGATRSGISSN